MINKLASLLLLFSACSHDPSLLPTSKTYKTKNVFIVIMDGARYSETWGEPSQQYIPHIKQLSATGVIANNFYNDGETITVAGHTAVTTGNYQLINNGGLEIPAYVSLFQLYLSQFAKPATDAWIFSSKDKLAVLADCMDIQWKGKFNPHADCGVNGVGTGYREDSVTYTHLIDTLDMYHPHLVVINFKHPDAAAHANNWSEYLSQIKTVDSYIGKLWKHLQSDSAYVGTTTMFVVNDHGRHLDGVADGFVSHGDKCEGCRHIMLMALGPDFKKNYKEQNHYSLVDIYSTTCDLLGINASANDGKVMRTIFQ